MNLRRKITWLDMLVYRLFYWRWAKLLRDRPDLRELGISFLKSFDVLDEGTLIKVTTKFEKVDRE